MRSLPGVLGVVIGLLGLFLGLSSMAAMNGISDGMVIAPFLIGIGLVLLKVDESLMRGR